MTYCAVKGCHNASHNHRKGSKITFHSFPLDPTVAARWIEKLRLNRKEECWKPTKNTKICSAHFDDKEKYITKGGLYKLSKSAVPIKGLHIYCTDESHHSNDHLHDAHGFDEPHHQHHMTMPLTAAERQKRYREKLKSTNPERFQDQKKKNSERTLRQYKTKAANYNEEQKEELRKKWREDRKKKENAPSISQQHAMKNARKTIDIPETSKKPKKPLETQKQKYDPFKEYANDSSDEELSDIKEEAHNSNDDDETYDATPNTEKVFVKSISGKGKQSIDGQSRAKRSRLDITEDFEDDYEEQLYEFGKYVAEQLLCLDVEDARVARMDIVAVLSKFAHKKTRVEIISKTGKRSRTVETEAQSSNPLVPLVTPMSQVNTTTESKFLIVNPAGKSASQTSQTKVIIRPSVSQTSQLNTGSSLSKPVMIRPASSQLAVMNMKPGSTSGVPLGYVVVPTTGSGINIVRLGNTGEALVTQPGSSVCVGSSVTQPSPIVISGGSLANENGSTSMAFPEILVKTEPESESTYLSEGSHDGSTMTQSSSNIVSTRLLMSQTESSSVEFSEISIKIEPELESTHVNVFESEEQESLVFKFEPESADET